VFILVTTLVVLVAIASVVQVILCITHIETWLTLILYFSYVKLSITLLKYIPQAYINFKRKSTIGWSIENILLDISGGILSFLQMFLDALNTGNWEVLYGGGAKLGLSIISIAFDVFFIVQHYCLYNNSADDYEKINDNEKPRREG